MSRSRRVRIIFSAGVVAAVVAVTSGIALAVGSASQSASVSALACVNAHQTLRLVSANGGCPSGFSRFRLAAAPTALTVNWTGGSPVSRTVTVGGLTFAGSCISQSNQSESRILMSSANSYVVQGTYFFNNADGNGFFAYGNGAAIQSGPGQISLAASPGGEQGALATRQQGGTTGSVVIVQSGHTMTVDFALFAFNNSCSVQAQITPSA